MKRCESPLVTSRLLHSEEVKPFDLKWGNKYTRYLHYCTVAEDDGPKRLVHIPIIVSKLVPYSERHPHAPAAFFTSPGLKQRRLAS